MKLLLGWAINAVALFLLPYIVPAVQVQGFGTALIVALVIGLLNTFIRPVLFILTLPIPFVTLGLFLLVVNAMMIGLVALLLPGMHVYGLFPGIGAAIITGVASWIGAMAIRDDRT